MHAPTSSRRSTAPPPRPAAPRSAVTWTAARRIAALLVAAAAGMLPARPAAADDVYLTNGRVFQDVVAERQADRVAIRLPHGVIRMPAAKVARIERAATPLAEYLRRREELDARPGRGSATDWVELALWARDHQLASAYRQAATIAANLEPHARGLAPLMRDLGLHYDETADRWMSEDELMGRRGYVRFDGAWVRPEVRAAAQASAAEAEARRLEARADAQRDRALVEMASALRTQAETQAAESRSRRRGPFDTTLPFVYSSPGWWTAPAAGRGAGGGHHGAGAGRDGDGDGAARPPAGDRPAANRGTFRASDWIPGRLNPRAAPPPGSLISGSSHHRD